MKLYDNLKKVSKLLTQYEGTWAICGGIAACLYREEPRYTGDIDIALVDTVEMSARQIAENIVGELGFKPKLGFITDQNNQFVKGLALITIREDQKGGYVGIDFLLPVLPWIPIAVARAQSNCLDYGFALLPTVTPEDLIIAKLFAFQGSPERPHDLDDMISISKMNDTLDRSYIYTQAALFDLVLPSQIKANLSLE